MVPFARSFGNLMVSFGDRLREERTRLGLNQTKFAAIAGVTKKTQGLYEAGDRAPDALYLAAIAGAGVDTTYVLTGDYLSVAQAKIAANLAGNARNVTAQSNAATSRHLTADEQELLELFRAAPLSRKAEAVRVLAGDCPPQPPKPKKEKGISVVGDGNRTAGENYHEKE